MRRCPFVRWAPAACLLVIAAGATAQDRPGSALEGGGFAGYARMVTPSVDHSDEVSARNGGGHASALVLYRSSHFLSPFFEAGYVQLYASKERKDIAGLGVLDSDSSLTAYSFVAGPAFDIWRLRIRGGIGMYRVNVESTVLGVTIHPSENDLGWFASVTGWVVETGGVKLGPEVRTLLISEASTASVSLGLTVGGDMIAW